MLSAKWQKSFVSLSESMIKKTLKFNELVELDWKFGGVATASASPLLILTFVTVTAATDELSTVGSCFLQLKLVLDKGGKREVRIMQRHFTGSQSSPVVQQTVLMELSLPQFYSFLQQMQAAKRQCES